MKKNTPTPSLMIVPVKTTSDMEIVATLAQEIWNQHFIPIIGQDQVNYMVEKFQSSSALAEQLEHGYEYFMLIYDCVLAGYCGIRSSDGYLFLSKLYVHQDFRGNHISTDTFHHLVNLCKERQLHKIWLTCNRHNKQTLEIYKHLGFIITREEVSDIGNGFIMDDYILEYFIA